MRAVIASVEAHGLHSSFHLALKTSKGRVDASLNVHVVRIRHLADKFSQQQLGLIAGNIGTARTKELHSVQLFGRIFCTSTAT